MLRPAMKIEPMDMNQGTINPNQNVYAVPDLGFFKLL